jgi:hypothetical protein
MLSTTRTAAVDFASKGLDTCWGMFFSINAKNYGDGIGKITNNLIDHVSDVHKTPTKVNVITIYYLTDKQNIYIPTQIFISIKVSPGQEKIGYPSHHPFK